MLLSPKTILLLLFPLVWLMACGRNDISDTPTLPFEMP